jgi:hypothetical protein
VQSCKERLWNLCIPLRNTPFHLVFLIFIWIRPFVLFRLKINNEITFKYAVELIQCCGILWYLLLEWNSQGRKFDSEITWLSFLSLFLLAGIITERRHVTYLTKKAVRVYFVVVSKATLLSKHRTMKVSVSGELVLWCPHPLEVKWVLCTAIEGRIVNSCYSDSDKSAF